MLVKVTRALLIPDWSTMSIVPVNVDFASLKVAPEGVAPVAAAPVQFVPPLVVTT